MPAQRTGRPECHPVRGRGRHGDARDDHHQPRLFRARPTNVNGALMAIEGTHTSQNFANIIAGGKQTTNEEWAAIQEERGT